MFMTEEYLKTGEKAKVSGLYSYNGPTDNKIGCVPTPEEQIIPLSRGEHAPPVKSCGSGAIWKLEKKT